MLENYIRGESIIYWLLSTRETFDCCKEAKRETNKRDFWKQQSFFEILLIEYYIRDRKKVDLIQEKCSREDNVSASELIKKKAVETERWSHIAVSDNRCKQECNLIPWFFLSLEE